MKIVHAPPTADLRPLSPFFGPECSKLGALNRHYKHVVYSVHFSVCELGFFLLFTFFFFGRVENFTKSLTIFGPAVRAGLRNRSDFWGWAGRPHTALSFPSFLQFSAFLPLPGVIRIEVSTTPTAVGFSRSSVLRQS